MFDAVAGFLVVGAVVIAFLAYQRSQASFPPPVAIEADDFDMIAARAKAQETLSEFRTLQSAHPANSLVKVPITSSADVVEWMIGSVVELTDAYVSVALRGRPATHEGVFESLQTFPVREIADWLVTLPNGRYRGGFTQRVHYERLRRTGALSKEQEEDALRFD